MMIIIIILSTVIIHQPLQGDNGTLFYNHFRLPIIIKYKHALWWWQCPLFNYKCLHLHVKIKLIITWISFLCCFILSSIFIHHDKNYQQPISCFVLSSTYHQNLEPATLALSVDTMRKTTITVSKEMPSTPKVYCLYLSTAVQKEGNKPFFL